MSLTNVKSQNLIIQPGCSILLASLAQQLAEWTKPGNWKNQVIVQASPKGEGHLAVLFLPGEEVTVNEQLAKRAKLDLTEGDQEIDFKHVSIILKARVYTQSFEKVPCK